MTTARLVVLVGLIAAFASPAAAVPITGSARMRVTSFSGTLSPFDVDLGSGPVSTGDLSFFLDTSSPERSAYIYDFDAAMMSASLFLRVDFPLLHLLGESPLAIHVVESGPLTGGSPDLPVGDQSLVLNALLVGGGIVEPGSIFSGAEYSNFNDTQTNNNNITVQPGGTVIIKQNNGDTVTVRVGAEVKFNGNVNVTTGSGAGTIPEAPAVLMFGLALIPIAYARYRDQPRRGASPRN